VTRVTVKTYPQSLVWVSTERSGDCTLTIASCRADASRIRKTNGKERPQLLPTIGRIPLIQRHPYTPHTTISLEWYVGYHHPPVTAERVTYVLCCREKYRVFSFMMLQHALTAYSTTSSRFLISKKTSVPDPT